MFHGVDPSVMTGERILKIHGATTRGISASDHAWRGGFKSSQHLRLSCSVMEVPCVHVSVWLV